MRVFAADKAAQAHGQSDGLSCDAIENIGRIDASLQWLVKVRQAVWVAIGTARLGVMRRALDEASPGARTTWRCKMHVDAMRIRNHVMQQLNIRVTGKVKAYHRARGEFGDAMVHTARVLQPNGTQRGGKSAGAGKDFDAMRKFNGRRAGACH